MAQPQEIQILTEEQRAECKAIFLELITLIVNNA